MEFTRQVIQANPNPTYVKDERGKFILANAAYADLHGLSVEELLTNGADVFDYSYERDLELLAGSETLSIEELYKLKNGEKVWFKTTKKPFTQPDGTRYLLSVSSDITTLKNALKAAENSAKDKESFLANISNEIRTPVSAIIGIARLMKKSFLNKDQEGYLNTITSIADNLLVIPNDLVDIAKLESGEIKLAEVPFDITSVVSDTVRAVAYKTQEQDVTINFVEPAEQIPVVEGDPFRLSQVLVNLLNIAIKNTRQGEITVTVHHVEKTGDSLKTALCVKGTGAKLIADKLEKVYDALSKEENSVTQLYGGTGLELTLSKKLLELQGGKLWLEKKPDQENCFYFEIPYPLSHKEFKLDIKEPTLKADHLKGLNILLAEDNQLNEILLTTQLQPWQIHTDVAYDGEQALAKAGEKEYDLILMDIQMPKLDGIEATYRLRNEQNPNKNTPIIAFTANMQGIDVERYMYYGFTDYLLKPYHDSRLLHIISKYTGRSTVPPVQLQQEPMLKEQAEPALFDFSGLGNLKDDALFIRKMQRMFVDTVPRQLDELAEAIERKELDTAAHIAHKLKSTFGNIRIIAATDAMKKIEAYAKGKTKTDEIVRLMHTVRGTTDKVVGIFSEQLLAAKQ